MAFCFFACWYRPQKPPRRPFVANLLNQLWFNPFVFLDFPSKTKWSQPNFCKVVHPSLRRCHRPCQNCSPARCEWRRGKPGYLQDCSIIVPLTISWVLSAWKGPFWQIQLTSVPWQFLQFQPFLVGDPGLNSRLCKAPRTMNMLRMLMEYTG